MRKVALIAAAAAVFVVPSFESQAQPKLSGDDFRRHTCDCRKMNPKDTKRWSDCMERRLAYRVDASTAASVVCPDTKKK